MKNLLAFLVFVGLGCAAPRHPPKRVESPAPIRPAALRASHSSKCNFGSPSEPGENPCGWEEIRAGKDCGYVRLRGNAFLHPSLMSTLLGPNEEHLPVDFRAVDIPDAPALRRWYGCAGKHVIVEGELKRNQAIPHTRRRGDVLIIHHMIGTTVGF